MHYAVGYQFSDPDEEPFLEVVKDYRDAVGEVYFAWLDMPSGRSPATQAGGVTAWEAQETLEHDLRAFRAMGTRLNLLLNAACYGGDSLSERLANHACSIVAHLQGMAGLDTVTTTSLMLAEVVKRHFPDVEMRASVNMRIGEVRAFECLRDLFDGFYLQRDYNRDLGRVRAVKDWCDAHGKRLFLLANSGCMRFCPAQSYHDNLVAHAAEIDGRKNVEGHGTTLCERHYTDRAHWVDFLRSTWIRPEDVHHYEGLCSGMKLATRTHSHPRKVIHAYASGAFTGNLLDLFEPGHGRFVHPRIMDNTRFPRDWFERTSRCGDDCGACGYCESVLQMVSCPTERRVL